MADPKQRKQLYVLGGLLAMAAVVWYFSFGWPKKVQGGFGNGQEMYQPIKAVDFGKAISDLDKARNTEYKSSGRNIFVAAPIPVPVTDAPKAEEPVVVYNQPQPPPPPPPPVLNMKFFGYGTLPSGGPREAFLLDGDEVHIVTEGEIVQNHLKITHIGNERIEFEDTNTGLRGSKQLEPMEPEK